MLLAEQRAPKSVWSSGGGSAAFGARFGFLDVFFSFGFCGRDTRQEPIVETG